MLVRRGFTREEDGFLFDTDFTDSHGFPTDTVNYRWTQMNADTDSVIPAQSLPSAKWNGQESRFLSAADPQSPEKVRDTFSSASLITNPNQALTPQSPRWRRLWRQRIQDLLIATVQNLRSLVRHAGAPVRGACSEALGQTVPAAEGLVTILGMSAGLFLGFEEPPCRPATPEPAV